MGGAPLEGVRSYRQVFDEVECYGVVAVRRGQEVVVRVPWDSAEVYAPPGKSGLAGAAAGRLRMGLRSGGCSGCTLLLWGAVPRIW